MEMFLKSCSRQESRWVRSVGNRSASQGNVLIITLFFLVILSITVGEALYMTNVQGRLSSRTNYSYKLYAASDAELERMYAQWKSLMNQQQLSTFQYPGPGDLYANVISTYYSDQNGEGSGIATLLTGTGVGLNGTFGVKIRYSTILTATYNNSSGANQFGSKTISQRIQSVNALGVPTATVSGSIGNLSPTSATYSADYPGHPGWKLLNTTYLAEVALKTTDLTGILTAHVGRTFTQSVIPVSQAAIFYDDNLTFKPGASMTIAGPIQTNGNLLINPSGGTLALTGNVSYSGSTVSIPNNGSTVVSSTAAGSTAQVAPNHWSSPMIPVPNDTYDALTNIANLSSSNSALKQNVNDGYRELLDPPVNAFSSGIPVANYNSTADVNDPSAVSRVRFFNQAGLRLVVSRTGSGGPQVVTAYDSNNNAILDPHGYLSAAINPPTTTLSSGSVATLNTSIYDYRQQANIEVTNIDLNLLNTFIQTLPTYNGIVYFTNTDQTANNSVITAVRLINGAQLPTSGTSGQGFTFATNDALYIQGDYNTRGGTVSSSGTIPLPSQVLADAVTVLSNSWNDANNLIPTASNVAGQTYGSGVILNQDLVTIRNASTTNINTSIVAGITSSTDSSITNPDGGAHNFIRVMENWSTLQGTNPQSGGANLFTANYSTLTSAQTLNFMGSIAQLFHSKVLNGLFKGNTTPTTDGGYVYQTPNRNWSYNPDIWKHPPPGTFANIQFVRGQWTRY